jgi:hypothetical protein
MLVDINKNNRLHITNVDENVEEMKLSYTVDENAKWCIHFGKHQKIQALIYHMIQEPPC